MEIDEEEYELGGYFILNGKERILRLILVPRRNVVQVFSRLSNTQRGGGCTVFSCSIRSVDRIQVSKTFHLHYLHSGGINFRILLKTQEFFVPIVILLKALKDISDREIFEKITNFNPKDKFLRERALIILKEGYEKCESLKRSKAQSYLGKIFRIALPFQNFSDYNLGKIVLSRLILIHLGENPDQKQSFLFFMIQKLLSVRKGLTCEDNPDSIENQEFLLPGNLIMIYLREKIENSLTSLIFSAPKFFTVKTKIKSKKNDIEKIFGSVPVGIEKILATGNFAAGLKNELSQTSGLSINLERLNFSRFLSYFRAIHRGKFFSDLKNTSGRKLFPQTWGFICPVHTPDGAPCGILNHLTSSVISSIFNPIEKKIIKKFILRFGLNLFPKQKKKKLKAILLDGQIITFVPHYSLWWLSDKLRYEKVSFFGILPICCEIFCILRSYQKTSFPSLVISSQESRPIRPLRWASSFKKKILNEKKLRNEINLLPIKTQLEIIGATEQSFLMIKNIEHHLGFWKSEIINTHSEVDSLNILSVIAGLIPFSNLNQSPRNIYQCQMSKQSIGFPFYTFWRKNDSKSFFLLTPQVPICRNKVIQDGLQFDAFPSGINAVVSVLTYTGFDMEDALVINRASVQRGFAHSNISSASLIDLKKKYLGKKQEKRCSFPLLDNDGFPQTEIHVVKGDPLYVKENFTQASLKKEASFCYHGSEKAVIEQVKFFTDLSKRKTSIKSLLKIRGRRRPFLGDKFASRHGQKGVISNKFSLTDLPFSENGIIPDIIFNPHGFPSRMTIGVILESVAGKLGATRGVFQDSSPFRFFKDRVSAYDFGEKLRQSGFQFFGGEILYSGYTGEPFQADTFVGLVQYQRLRHMVLDKFQVSPTGPRNILTRQPTKGRKMGGAIRLGEMERDSLLGHGCVYLLHDRLQNSSDLHSSLIETKKGNFWSKNKIPGIIKSFRKKHKKKEEYLNRRILSPYVLKYLITELATLNVKIFFKISEI